MAGAGSGAGSGAGNGLGLGLDFLTPPGMVSNPSCSSLSSESVATSTVWSVRDAIYAATRVVGASADTLGACLAMLRNAIVIDAIGNLPSDLCGSLLVHAISPSAHSQRLVQRTCDEAHISLTSANAVLAKLQALVQQTCQHLNEPESLF